MDKLTRINNLDEDMRKNRSEQNALRARPLVLNCKRKMNKK